MLRTSEQAQLLNEIGGEPLEGSGFEHETPDPSYEVANANTSTDKRRRSGTKKERRDVQ